jgi:hypothetical protein
VVPTPSTQFHYARFIDEGVANAWLDKWRREEVTAKEK